MPLNRRGGLPSNLPPLPPSPRDRSGTEPVPRCWRWHFYAGVLIAPILFVIAVTGALYVFKDELDRVFCADTANVHHSSVRHDSSGAAGAGRRGRLSRAPTADTIEVDTDPTRATSMRLRGGSGFEPRPGARQPAHGSRAGAIGDYSFFRVVLDLHRRLFLGTTGRAVVETVTCWTIVLLGTGLFPWWPRRPRALRGVLVPRLRARPCTVLRDLHAITGAVLLPIAMTIAFTGLVYTLIWGSGYSSASAAAATAPRSVFAAGSAAASARSSRGHHPRPRPPGVVRRREAVHRSRGGDRDAGRSTNPAPPPGPKRQIVLALDRSTGEVLDLQTSDRYATPRW